MNELPKTITTGTFGEVFLQLKFLQHAVQAAPPLKDSGNDLIAIRRETMKAVQVKTQTADFPVKFDLSELPERYHLLALIVLVDFYNPDLIDFRVSLDKSHIFLLERHQVTTGYFTEEELEPYRLGKERIDQLFPIVRSIVVKA